MAQRGSGMDCAGRQSDKPGSVLVCPARSGRAWSVNGRQRTIVRPARKCGAGTPVVSTRQLVVQSGQESGYLVRQIRDLP